jgi:hypothetical protein
MKHRNIRATTLITYGLFLSGCATFGQMENGLQALMGQDISTAFNVIGYPQGKQQFGSDTVYYWDKNYAGTIFVPQISSTSGSIGNTSFNGYTSYTQAIPVSYACSIKLVERDGRLSSYEYSGNIGGCKNYIDHLNTFYKNSRNDSQRLDQISHEPRQYNDYSRKDPVCEKMAPQCAYSDSEKAAACMRSAGC